MYLQLLNINKFIESNTLEQITNPIFLEHGRPTEDGLFSSKIFGITPYDRSTIWAYMDLGDIFIHPLAAINLKKYSRKLEHLVFATKNFIFKDGDFIEDENGNTGIRFLYDNFDKIKWRETDSVFSNERIKFLRDNKDLIFITKFPVTPPFYRDIHDGDVMGVHKINNKYKTILSQTIALRKRMNTFSLFGNTTRSNIQRTLIEIFEYYVDEEFSGKTGIMRQNIMGVDVDRANRLVISAPVISANKYDDMLISFERSGVPLASCCSIGYDFILKGVKDWFDNEFVRSGKYPINNNGEKVYVTFEKGSLPTEDWIKKRIDEFIDSPSTRFEKIRVPKNKEGLNDKYVMLTGRFGESTIKNRPMTWTDLLYIVASRVLENKYISVTRYPIEDFYCIFHTKISILTTINTEEVSINGILYKNYPIVNPDEDSSSEFIDTMVFSNLYLKGINGDYDGDQTIIRLLYTDEANMDLDAFVKSKKNFLSYMGDNIRTTERDFIQSIYSLTRHPRNKECKLVPLS